MKLLHVNIPMASRKMTFELYPLGDIHLGKRNCAETPLRRQVARILAASKDKSKAIRVILGGDIINAITPQDLRFSFDDLPNWLLEGKIDTIKDKLNNIVTQEVKRATEILSPISHLLIGAIEGTHELFLKRRGNFDAHALLCDALHTTSLTDEAFIRFAFTRCSKETIIIKLYIQHGHLTGRSSGAEPNHLANLLLEWGDADLILRGHSHTFHIMPPKPVLYLPTRGRLPSELLCRHRFAANWGCWLYSHSTGSATYESEKTYPSRPMMSTRIVINPFHHTQYQHLGTTGDYTQPQIDVQGYPLP